MKVAHGPELQNWSRADRLSGSRGCLVFCLPGPLYGYQTLCKSRKILECDRELGHLVQLCTRDENDESRTKELELGTCCPQQLGAAQTNSSYYSTNYKRTEDYTRGKWHSSPATKTLYCLTSHMGPLSIDSTT